MPEEEIEENLTIQPGNVSTLLNELAGVRMESTAPGLGGAALQMRGMPGRLTQVLSDGLPLAGSESGGFGLLQTPPLDLKRVEVIKGVASALYGGSALGGVLNLVSMPPGGEPELLAQSHFARRNRRRGLRVGFAVAATGAIRCRPAPITRGARTWTTMPGRISRAISDSPSGRGSSSMTDRGERSS